MPAKRGPQPQLSSPRKRGTISHRPRFGPRWGPACAGTTPRLWSMLLLAFDRVDQHADALDVDLADVARLHPHRVRLARVADARGRAGEDDVAGLERDALGDVGDGLGDR